MLYNLTEMLSGGTGDLLVQHDELVFLEALGRKVAPFDAAKWNEHVHEAGAWSFQIMCEIKELYMFTLSDSLVYHSSMPETVRWLSRHACKSLLPVRSSRRTTWGIRSPCLFLHLQP